MRNDEPQAIRCALCTGYAHRHSELQDGWVEHEGRVYFLCPVCLAEREPAVVQGAWTGEFHFEGTPTLRDLERRVEALEGER